MKKHFRRRLGIQSLESRRLLAAVQIPDDLSAAPAAIVSVPVNVDDASGIRAAEIRLSYDPTRLNLDVDAITLGSVWQSASDAQITTNIDEAAGTIVIFVAASAALPSASGSLVNLPFSIPSSAAAGSTTVIDLTEVTLNEGQIPVQPAPIVGPDPTDGRVRVSDEAGQADQISGFVHADANGNNQVDPGEAIPGVTITLINTTTSVERQTTTGADGGYRFDSLPAGSYRIVQSQPPAYLDGGVNEITVSLTAGQSLENQNFRERGLRPQFISNRLHTSAVQPPGSAAWDNAIARINDLARTETNANAPTQAASIQAASTAQSNQSGSSNAGATGTSQVASIAGMSATPSGDVPASEIAATNPAAPGTLADPDEDDPFAEPSPSETTSSLF